MSATKHKILVVEDNFMNKVLVKEILTLHGYEVIEAKSGTEAIKAINALKPDVILMDIHLPEMDGITATRIIKSDARNRHIPILALTASAMKGEEENLMSKGFDGYVAKPIDRKRLLETIIESLGARRTSADIEGQSGGESEG